MTLLRRAIHVFPVIFLSGLSSHAFLGAAPIGPDAVWQSGPEAIGKIMQACGSAHGQGLNACFIEQMQAAGASSEAVAFAKELYAGTNGQVGFLRKFRHAGKVDIGYVEYVFRANENLACYLVNGRPALIDVDNFKLLAMDALEKNERYRTIKARYANVSIWPGDRFTTREPLAKALPQGGQRFICSYWLQKGCHACARIGDVQFAFDFDATGKFLGTRLQSVRSGEPGHSPDQKR